MKIKKRNEKLRDGKGRRGEEELLGIFYKGLNVVGKRSVVVVETVSGDVFSTMNQW